MSRISFLAPLTSVLPLNHAFMSQNPKLANHIAAYPTEFAILRLGNGEFRQFYTKWLYFLY